MFELSETQQQLREQARRIARKEFLPLAAEIEAAEIERSGEYPWDNVKLLTEVGFMGFARPGAYGGPGPGTAPRCRLYVPDWFSEHNDIGIKT